VGIHIYLERLGRNNTSILLHQQKERRGFIMSVVKSIEQAFERFILDPKNHDALTLVKGVRNGIIYGTKVRFPHALV
jgi:hypothetical protein